MRPQSPSGARGWPLPLEANYFPSWKRLLREARVENMSRFRRETHFRATWMSYRYPHGACKEREAGPPAFKPNRRDAWDFLRTPDAETPRLLAAPIGPSKPLEPEVSRDPVEAWALACGARKSKSKRRHRPPAKPLPIYRLDSDEFGPDTHCEGLEPFDALSHDDFLASPDEPPLTPNERRHLLRVDFQDIQGAGMRERWMPYERERWRRSKRLRYLMRKGLVVIREDFLREEFEKDFIKYMGRPPKPREMYSEPLAPVDRSNVESGIPRGERTEEEELGNSVVHAQGANSVKASRMKDSHCAPFPRPYRCEIKKPNEPLPPLNAFLDFQEQLGVQENLKLQCILETEALRVHEAATGTLPSIFAGLCPVRKKKHPNGITVPFLRLKAYGEMIDQATSCRLLQNEVSKELLDGINEYPKEAKIVEHMPPPRGSRKNPNYELTPGKIKKAAAKLRVETSADADFITSIERRRRGPEVEGTHVVGGGRYAV